MFKSLYKETEGFRLVSILTPLCMIGEVVMEMIIPKLMSSIIDDGVTAGNLSHIYRIGGWMIVAAAFGLLFGVLGGVFGARASTGYARNLRRSMYRNIQTFSFANIDKYSTAGLVTRMTTDVTNIQNAYQMILRMAIRAPSSMVIAMIMAFTINAKLASIYLVAVIILGGCLVLIMSRASNYFSAAFKKYDDLNESVQENVSAIRVVKAYVREDYESEKFKKASGNVQDLLLRAEKVLSFNSPLMMATVYTCILLISWLGARMIVLSGATSFTTGELMSMLTYCTNILTSLMMLSMVFIMISMSAASAKRVAEVLEEESTLSNGEKTVMEVKNGAVRFDHVCFRYKADGRDVLSDINLNIRSGETIGIIGGTGSAKSTLVNLIARLYDATEGTVRVGGVDVRQIDPHVLMDQIAFVFQNSRLLKGSILDNVRLGRPQATEAEVLAALKAAQCMDIVEKFPAGIHTVIGTKGVYLSGGEQQRIAIARAMLKNAPVLILDEATAFADPDNEAKVQAAFARLAKGKTVLMIAHRLSTVANADCIYVVQDGQIAESGTKDELCAQNGLFARMWQDYQASVQWKVAKEG